MADIFLSYAREDLNRAIAISRALTEAGLSVWFDLDIPPASRWEDHITRELGWARCVLMLWSHPALSSDWVLKEGLDGFERGVLVPVRLDKCDIPNEFASIQFADLTSWDGSTSAIEIAEVLRCVQTQMSPRSQIAFDSLLEVRAGNIETLYDAYLTMSERLGCMPAPGQFRRPQTPEGQRKLHRAVASLQVSIDWHPILKRWYSDPTRHDRFSDRARRIERHIPLLWLRMLSYCGPFFSGNVSGPWTHRNYLRFASMKLFHAMVREARALGKQVDVPPPLTEAELQFPRWEGCLAAIFDEVDDVARGYVTHIDDQPLLPEEVIYGPKYRLQIAYGKSLQNGYFTEPLWLERYLIPQRELRIALEGSSEHTEYRGHVRIRKITDLNGDDIEPLYK
jgi:hypothetical protein